MDNCTQSLNQMMINTNASDIDNKQTENLSLLDLLNIEPDIIIEIFTLLSLQDRLSLAMTCSKLEDLLLSQEKLLENIQSCWFDDDKIKSTFSSILYRKCVNCKLDFNFDIAEPVPKEVLTAFRPFMKKLHVKWEWSKVKDSRPSRMRPEKLIEILPMFTNLVQLELLSENVNRGYLPRFNRDLIGMPAIVTFRNLQSLKIKFDLFAALHGRFVDFLQCSKLKTLEIAHGEGYCIGLYDHLKDQLYDAMSMLKKLISSLNELKVLKLNFLFCAFMLSDPFNINSQLTEFELTEQNWLVMKREAATQQSQDHLMNIFESQSNLILPKFHFKIHLPISSRMSVYFANKLDAQITTLIVDIKKDSVACFSNESLCIPDSELSQILRESVQPNITIINLTLKLIIEGLSITDWLIESVCKKYPNLKILSINQRDFSSPLHPSALQPLNFRALSSLQQLNTLVMISVLIDYSLRDFKIANLRWFWLKLTQDNSDVLQQFLGNHELLTHLRFQIWTGKNSLKWLHFAIRNLKELIEMDCDGIVLSDKSERNKIRNLIREHQKDGFTLKLKYLHDKNEWTVFFKKRVDRVEVKQKKKSIFKSFK